MEATTLIAGAIIAVGGAIEVLRRMVVKPVARAIRAILIIHDVVMKELVPNCGGAIVDKVHQIDARLTRIEQRRKGE